MATEQGGRSAAGADMYDAVAAPASGLMDRYMSSDIGQREPDAGPKRGGGNRNGGRVMRRNKRQ